MSPMSPDGTSSPSSIVPPLSIFRVTAKRRKPIFDADIFKRPEAPSAKLDYVSLSKARPQSPPTRAGGGGASQDSQPATPPTPPTRSDSFKVCGVHNYIQCTHEKVRKIFLNQWYV